MSEFLTFVAKYYATYEALVFLGRGMATLASQHELPFKIVARAALYCGVGILTLYLIHPIK